MQIRARDVEAFEFKGNEIGCLLVHGFTGSPGEMRPLGEYLHTKGYTIKGALLPGHGTKVEDLAATDWQDWYGAVEKSYHELSAKCRQVFPIGLSMGGALILHLAANNTVIGGIIPICAPIFLAKKKAYLSPILQYFMKYSRKKSYANSNYESFWYDQYPLSGTASLVKNLPIIKSELRRINNPALIIQSTLDKTVAPQSAQFIFDNLGSKAKELYWLNNSGHIATLDTERLKVFKLVEEFIQRNVKEVF
ncbi:MAG: alpha/beta hydrolase [Bacillota bacterium]